MSDTMGRLFWNGRSQAVRLPKEFRFRGDRVRIRRAGQGIVLEPMITGIGQWFNELDKFGEPFMREGRGQPKPPVRGAFP